MSDLFVKRDEVKDLSVEVCFPIAAYMHVVNNPWVGRFPYGINCLRENVYFNDQMTKYNLAECLASNANIIDRSTEIKDLESRNFCLTTAVVLQSVLIVGFLLRKCSKAVFGKK